MSEGIGVLIMGASGCDKASESEAMRQFGDLPGMRLAAEKLGEWAVDHLQLALRHNHVQSLFDDHLEPSVMLDQMEAKIRRFAANEELRTLLVFIIGHGVAIEEGIGIPIRSSRSRSSDQLLSARVVIERAAQASENLGHLVIVFDTCFSGVAAAELSKAVKRLTKPPTFLTIIGSSHATQTAEANESGTQFTDAWIAACDALGQDDQAVDVEQIISAVADRLQDVSAVQIPQRVSHRFEQGFRPKLPLVNGKFRVVRSIYGKLQELRLLGERLQELEQPQPEVLARLAHLQETVDTLLESVREPKAKHQTGELSGLVPNLLEEVKHLRQQLEEVGLFARKSWYYAEGEVLEALRRLAGEIRKSGHVTHLAVAELSHTPRGWHEAIEEVHCAFEDVLRAAGTYKLFCSDSPSRQARLKKLAAVKGGIFFCRFPRGGLRPEAGVALTMVIMTPRSGGDRTLYIACGGKDGSDQVSIFCSDPNVVRIFEAQFSAEYRRGVPFDPAVEE